MAKTIKTTIQSANDGALFLIKRIDSDNSEKVETCDANKVLDHKTVARLVNGIFKQSGTMQDAWQSMLAEVFANVRLDGYKGTGDKSTGKTSKEFKQSVRACEDEYFETLRSEKLIALPKSDNPEKTFQTYCTTIREDKNYSNIKSTVSKYFAFVGALPATQSGYLVPKAVMLAQIADAQAVAKPDNGLYAQLLAIKAELDRGTVSEADAAKSEPLAREIASILKGTLAHYAELSTNAAQKLPANAGDTGKVATEIIGRMRRAPAPTNDVTHNDATV